MKTDAVYKQTFNRALELIAQEAVGADLPSENALRQRMGVSRTTVRKVLNELVRQQIVSELPGPRFVRRGVEVDDYFPDAQTTSRVMHVERQFMEWMLRGDTRPGTSISELELARQFGVATTGVREFLIRFSRFGLIEKRPNSGWLFKGFNTDFALELFEIRMMFELRSARAFATLPDASPLWQELAMVEHEHRELLKQVDSRFHDFSGLDNRFHRLINEAAPNRFIDDFYDIIAFIFHYHYQWNKKYEKQRNRAAMLEHLAYIEALGSRDLDQVEIACRTHLKSARETLLGSLMEVGEALGPGDRERWAAA